MKDIEILELNKSCERTTYLSVLNIFACISVIGIHCNQPFGNVDAGWKFVVSCFLNASYYFANGMFFMLSGATLIDYRKRYNTKTFFQKRFKRTVVPFFCWSLIALMIRLHTGSIVINKTSVLGVAKQILDLFLSNGIIYRGVYWFLYVLFPIYFIIPLISAIPEGKRKKLFLYAIITLFLFYSIIPWFRDNLIYIKWNFDNGGVIPYLLFVFLGYYLKNYKISDKIQTLINIMGITAYLLLSAGTIWLSFKYNAFVGMFCGWYRFCAVALCCMIFTNAKKYLNFNDNKGVFRIIASASLGIYLMHIFIVHCIPLALNIDTYNPLWFILSPIYIYIVLLCITLFLKKIPFLKYLVP